MFFYFQSGNQFYKTDLFPLSFLDYVKAYDRKLISLDHLYQAAFDGKHYIGLNHTFCELQPIICYPESLAKPKSCYLKEKETKKDSAILQIAQEIYWNIVEIILQVELKRSETCTQFSYVIDSICKIRGAAYLIEILTALGNDTFSYNRYEDKVSCLSHLLLVSEPLLEENGTTLKKLLKGKKNLRKTPY